MENAEKVKNWLNVVIAGLVSKPEEIQIEQTSDERGILYTIKVAPGDRGKVLGKKGNIAKALRTITTSAGYLIDIRASVIIHTPDSNFKLNGGENPRGLETN